MRHLSFLAVCVGLLGCGPSASGTDAGDQGCRGASKTPANLLGDPGFDCSTSAWAGIYGDFELQGGGRSGKAARVTVTGAGGRFGLAMPFTENGEGKKACVQAYVRGTAPVLKTALLSGGQRTEFAEPLTSEWKKTPPSFALDATVAPGNSATLIFEIVTSPGPTQATVGQYAEVDDVDVWLSTDGTCDEVR